MTPPDPPTDLKDRLIVALDVETVADAERLLDRLQGQVTRFKIGSQLFTAAGPAAVESVHKRGAEVFLDLKFHDIPNTVAGAAREAARLGVLMFNVHASGGRAMMAAAAEGATAAAKELGVRKPIALAVTVLTSLDRGALSRELGVARGRADPQSIGGLVDPPQLGDPIERHQVRGHRPLALPGPNDEVGPARDGSMAGSGGGQGVGQRCRSRELSHVRRRPSSPPGRPRRAPGSSAARSPGRLRLA